MTRASLLLAAIAGAVLVAGCFVPDDIAERQQEWTFVNRCEIDLVLRVARPASTPVEELIRDDVGKRLDASGGKLTFRGLPGELPRVVVFDTSDAVLVSIDIDEGAEFTLDGDPCRLETP